MRHLTRGAGLCLLALILTIGLAVIGLVPSTSPAAGDDHLPWLDESLPAAERAELLLAAMSLDQKLQQIYNEPVYNEDLDDDGDPDDDDPGDEPRGRWDCDFTPVGRHIEGIPELGIPDFRMANGGTGIRGGDCVPEPIATALPAQVAGAATFDKQLNREWGALLDVEMRAWAHHVLWGPTLNMPRTPYGGRNSEYLSEDPYLTGALSTELVKGVQQRGVSQATVKHFVANDSEYQFERWTSANRIPPRAMHQIYLLPFEMAVKEAQPAAVMCSYTHVNWSYACDSQPLLQQTLRQRWGFDGYVYSDRRAQQSTLASILAGVSVEVDETPEFYQPGVVKALINSGQITEDHIDDLLRPRYIKMFEFGDFDDPHATFLWDELDPLIEQGGAHAQLAKRAAADSLVLLRNERNILPLNAGAVESVALIGADWFAGEATLPPRSGDREENITVIEPYQVTPQEGLENVLAANGGEDAVVTYNDGDVIADAVEVAEDADITILMVGDVARETWDKNSNWQEENPGGGTSGAGNEVPDLDLPSVNGTNQQQLIPQILDANPNTIVVLKTQGQVNLPRIDDMDTLVQAWYPGQEDGNVVAEALFGVTNFSGKMPVTWGGTDREAAYERQEQYPGNLENTGIPGGIGRDPLCVNGAGDEEPSVLGECPDGYWPQLQRVVRYSEGLNMGYRWYQATGTEPVFPFGHGLSYTDFEYSDLAVTEVGGGNGHTAVQVDYTVTNTGDVAGAEASQVYLTLPWEARESFDRLVGFEKVQLDPGESRRVSVVIDSNASNHPFSYFEPDHPDNLRRWADGEWKTPDGSYTVHVGGSSVDTPLDQAITLNFSNTSPTAQNVTGVQVRQGESAIIELAASDPDGDALSYTYSELGGHTVTPLGNGSVVRFMPWAGFTGQTTFRYTVDDGHGGTATATVTVTVLPAATPTPTTTPTPTPGPGTKDPSRISRVKVTPKRLTPQTRAKVRFRVRSGGEAAEGRFVIKVDGRVVARGSLDDDGRASTRIKRLDLGKKVLRIVYKGSADSERATKRKVIRIRRR